VVTDAVRMGETPPVDAANAECYSIVQVLVQYWALVQFSIVNNNDLFGS